MKKHYRIMSIVATDAFLINFALFLSLWIHGEGQLNTHMISENIHILVAITLVKLLTFKKFALYASLWAYASIEELMKVVGAVIAGSALSWIFIALSSLDQFIGVYIIAVVFEMAFVGGNRFSYRILRRVNQNKSLTQQNDGPKVLIIGSGSTASLIATEIKTHPKQYGQVVGYICQDESKRGKIIGGITVLGNVYDILSIVKRKKVTEIIIAIPTATKEYTKEVLDECKRSGAKVKIVPGILEVIEGHVSMNAIRDVEIEDLLGRDPVNLNNESISSYLEGKRVMVTGGGGSIGSELCRQIAKFKPSKLIILDIYENNAYEIQNELGREYGETLDLEVLIASVRDEKGVFRIMKEEKPEVVFHAAAHKHVPLMERSPKEAIKNNVFGTYNVAKAAEQNGVERFVLISTDKAVNPTNVMGATKRLCEMIIQSMAAHSKTNFAAVRFGNVLGSNGSVIPLFKKQIAEGGPITVTHQNIIRYFMTIPEASQLVIQAGAIAKGGEIFVLDMGEPVRIYELAEDLIRLSGLKPHEDIEIKVTGLRPGEKMYEELLMDEEGMTDTSFEKIHIGAPMKIELKILEANLQNLQAYLKTASDEEVVDRLKVLVPTFKSPEELEASKLIGRSASLEPLADAGL